MTKTRQNSQQLTLEELKERIAAAVVTVDQENLCCLWTELEYWATVCRVVNKRHVDIYIRIYIFISNCLLYKLFLNCIIV